MGQVASVGNVSSKVAADRQRDIRDRSRFAVVEGDFCREAGGLSLIRDDGLTTARVPWLQSWLVARLPRHVARRSRHLVRP